MRIQESSQERRDEVEERGWLVRIQESRSQESCQERRVEEEESGWLMRIQESSQESCEGRRVEEAAEEWLVRIQESCRVCARVMGHWLIHMQDLVRSLEDEIFFVAVICCSVCCNVLQCVSVCCSVLQCVAVCFCRSISLTRLRRRCFCCCDLLSDFDFWTLFLNWWRLCCWIGQDGDWILALIDSSCWVSLCLKLQRNDFFQDIHMYVYIYMYIWICMDTARIYMHIYICKYVSFLDCCLDSICWVSLCLKLQKNDLCQDLYIRVYVYLCIYKYICMYMYICIYTCRI